MIVLDTHAWLWWRSAEEKLSGRAREEIDGASRVGVCTISCYEVVRAATRGRIALDRDPWTWVRSALSHPLIEPIELTGEIAARAGALGEEFPGDPVDRIIYSTTIERHARLVTRDRVLRQVDPAATVW